MLNRPGHFKVSFQLVKTLKPVPDLPTNIPKKITKTVSKKSGRMLADDDAVLLHSSHKTNTGTGETHCTRHFLSSWAKVT